MKDRYRTKLAAGLAGLLLLAWPTGVGCGGTAVTVVQDPQRFYDAEDRFSIKLTDRWRLQDKPDEVGLYALGRRAGPDDTRTESLSLDCLETEEEMTLDRLVEEALADLPARFESLQEQSRRAIRIDKTEAIRILFTFRSGDKKRTLLSYFVLTRSRGYILTFLTDTDRFAERRAQFDAVAQTLRFYPDRDSQTEDKE